MWLWKFWNYVLFAYLKMPFNCPRFTVTNGRRFYECLIVKYIEINCHALCMEISRSVWRDQWKLRKNVTITRLQTYFEIRSLRIRRRVVTIWNDLLCLKLFWIFSTTWHMLISQIKYVHWRKFGRTIRKEIQRRLHNIPYRSWMLNQLARVPKVVRETDFHCT